MAGLLYEKEKRTHGVVKIFGRAPGGFAEASGFVPINWFVTTA
jgi:hypothetical protein